MRTPLAFAVFVAAVLAVPVSGRCQLAPSPDAAPVSNAPAAPYTENFDGNFQGEFEPG